MVSSPPTVDLEQVRAQLLEIELADPATAPRRDEEGEPLWDPVVVFESISREDFREWLDYNEGDLRRWWYEPIDEETGRVLVYSLPSHVHEAAASEVLKSILRPLRCCERDVIDTLLMKASPRCKLFDRDQEPDMTLTPMACLAEEFPNVVVDIAYENVSRCQLEEKLLRWMGAESTVRVAIGIKIDKRSRNHVAILHARCEPKKESKEKDEMEVSTQIVRFGKHVTSPQPLVFPMRALYYGAEIPLHIRRALDTVSINLVALRSIIDELLDVEAEEKKRCVVNAQRQAEPAKKKTCRRLSMKDFRARLRKIECAESATARTTDDEGEPLWDPIVLFDSISRTAFREWLSEHKGAVHRWWFKPLEGNTGRVVVHSPSSAVQQATIDSIVSSIQLQHIQMGDVLVVKNLRKEVGPIYKLVDRDQEADTSLTPTQLRFTQVFPNLVIDVVDRNVSLVKLRAKLRRWMGSETKVQIAIGVKINENTITHVAILHVRGEQPQEVHFGAGEENPPLTFPVDSLYFGTTIPSALVDRDRISVDLQQLSVDIATELNQR